MRRILLRPASGWRSFLAAAVVAIILAPTIVTAQIREADSSSSKAAPRLGPAVVARYRVGVRVVASGGARDIRAMVATPLECPEQQVQVIDEEFSPEVQSVDFRLLPGDGARQMLVRMPHIPRGNTGVAMITYDVATHRILPPEDKSQLSIPKRPSRELKRYLGVSPYIDVKHRKIRAALAEALASLNEEPATVEKHEDVDASAGDEVDSVPFATNIVPAASSQSTDEVVSDDWRRIEAIYDYVLDRIEYEEGVDKSSVQVLEEGRGDCQAIGALFVAMCRTEKTPARLVWVHDHQYAEFYLEDAEGEGHWYPIETAGTRAFGEMPLPRVILQKGDNFQVPERKRERLRYASDYLLGFPLPGGSKPKVSYIREQL